MGNAARRRLQRPACTGPIKYIGHAALAADIANLKAALAATGAEEGFMCSIAPGSFARGEDLYYKTEEEFLFASADALREEYQAIVNAGMVLQIDDPSLPDNWDMINPEPPLGEFKKFEQVRIEALNHALRGLPSAAPVPDVPGRDNGLPRLPPRDQPRQKPRQRGRARRPASGCGPIAVSTVSGCFKLG
jgi:methionine synthase II (cobalamin-independent)